MLPTRNAHIKSHQAHLGGSSSTGNIGARPTSAFPRNDARLSFSQAPTNRADFWCLGENTTSTGTSWRRV